MSQQTADRAVTRMGDSSIPELFSLGVKATQKIFKGAIVCTDATGYAVEGSTTTGLIAWGVAQALADNTSGSSGAINVEVRAGAFKFKNDGGDPVTVANVGGTVYITDDQTVSATSAGKSAAGKMVKLDSDGGVWVLVGLSV